MTRAFKRISIFLLIVLVFQFLCCESNVAAAEKNGSEAQKIFLQRMLQNEFGKFYAESLKFVDLGGFTFVTDGSNRLFVVNTHDPAQLRVVTYLDFPEKISLIGIYESRIYLPTGNNLYIVDAADPLHPDLVRITPAHQEGAVRISDLAFNNGAAYVNGVRYIICEDGQITYVVNDLGAMSLMDYAGYPFYVDGTAAENTEKEKDENQKTAYITIDDGPSRSITTMNLDTLKKLGIKATFFVLPRENVDDIYKKIIDEGHVIGNHSYSHDYNYLYSSTKNFIKDVIKARDYVYKKTGYTSTVFRFPGGTMGLNKSMTQKRSDLLAQWGYRYFDWDVSTADTDPNLKTYGNEEYIVNILANNVLKNTKNRKKLIILMHDSAGKIYSAKALPKIIEGLQKQGYEFDVLTNY